MVLIMGHRSFEPRREIEALLDSLEGILVRAALFDGFTQREIATKLDTSKSRVHRLAHDVDAPSPLCDATGYALATRMLSRTPIVEIAAAQCWAADARAGDPVPLVELRAAVEADLACGAAVRIVSSTMPAPGTEEAESLLGLLWEWSRRGFVDVAPRDELRVGVYLPRGPREAASPLPRVPAATVAMLLGVPVEAVPAEWLDNGLRPVGTLLQSL